MADVKNDRISAQLRDWLKLGLSGTHAKYYEFILKNGRHFTSRCELGSEMGYVKRKACYRNSVLTHLYTGLEYYEGFYLTDLIPFAFEHAFNVSGDGELYDVTVQKFGFEVLEWFGVPIPRVVLLEWLTTDHVLTPLQFYFRQTLTQNPKK